MNMIKLIYDDLYNLYGPQGWWPFFYLHLEDKGNNPTKTGFIKGYHINNYDYPKNNKQIFEVIIGSLLTQNTNWQNVEKSLVNLYENDLFTAEKIAKSNIDVLKNLIKPSGYNNQKAERLILISKWFINLKKIPSRDELLKLKGVGPETADSILLYGYKIPEFVVDTYTKRIFENLSLINKNSTYDEIKDLFTTNLDKDYIIFNEYHALLVEHAKRYYRKKEDYVLCPLYQKYKVKK